MNELREKLLPQIRKVHTVSTGYTADGAGRCTAEVNGLLAQGWRVLEIQKVEYGAGQGEYNVIYHLGHTNAEAVARGNE